jgi:hypothetical protein
MPIKIHVVLKFLYITETSLNTKKFLNHILKIADSHCGPIIAVNDHIDLNEV